MNQRSALLFDLDGTLVDSAVGIAAALSLLSLRRGGEGVDIALVRRLVSCGVETLVREALGTLATTSAADVEAFREILRDLPADPDMIFDGVPQALRDLQTAGHACAIVTNKPEGLARRLLSDLALTSFFGAIVGGDTLVSCKPDPAPLHHALAILGATVDKALMIGDSLVDASAAAAAGMPFILFEGGYGGDECDEGRGGIADRFAAFDLLVAAVDRNGHD